MFDGNFRSKREVNLGNRSNRRRDQQKRSNNKQDLLRNAQELRKQRQQQQNHEKAARLIQRVARGWAARLRFLECCLSRNEIAAVSMCLSLRKLLPYHSTSAFQVLLLFSNNDSFISRRGDNPTSTIDKADSGWFSHERILRSTLQCFTPMLYEVERRSLFSILENLLPILSIKNDLFVDLALCFKLWWHESTSDDNITYTLLYWVKKARESLLDTLSADALLGSILLSASSERVRTVENAYKNWFLPVATVFDRNELQSDDVILKAAFKNLRGVKEEQTILLSALEIAVTSTNFTDAMPIVSFVSRVLTKTNSSPLTVMSSLMVRGDSLVPTAVALSAEEVYEESDHEEEAEDVSKPDVKRQRPTSRYTKKDLLTVTKLDKIYQDRIEQLKSQSNVDAATQALANKVVDAPWLTWGLQILEETPKVQRYVQSLFVLLQASSGLRSTMKLGVFSKLSFSKRFMELLWRIVTQSSDYTSLVVFCDLFSHYLVALSDLEFVRLHADHANELQASDIVNHLRNVLFDVYWSKPVLTSEICPANPRARILLSGTKLWNSLYERWNRLVRSPFCDESTWWFPHLASKDGDRAVLSSREQQQEAEQDDDYSMDENDGSDSGSNDEMRASKADSLADSFSDPKMARVLTCIPQAIPFDRRVRLFNALLKADKLLVSQQASNLQALMAMQGGEQNVWMDGTVREKVQIRRGELYNDSMRQLNALGKKLKHQVQVTFINQLGAEEAGIDGGGVFKEFLDDLIKDGFASRANNSGNGTPALFTITPNQTLAINTDVLENEAMLPHYEFLGRVLGKALYEQILVEPQFCLPFLNQLLGKQNSTEDLKNLDEEFYKNLMKLRSLSDKEIETLGLTFEMTIGNISAPRTIELIPGGGIKAVNSKNVFQFIHLLSHHRLNILGSIQTRSFLRGFRDLIPASWVRLFSASELQKLISGDDSIHGISVGSLKQAMQYGGGYHPTQPYIQDFWSILEDEFTPEQQRKFLKFMTSCSRQPLLGFGSLEPAPAIQQIRLSDEEITEKAKLPTSQTCFNLLKLPNYKNRDLLKKKLIDAIESGAGFELT